MIPVTKPYLPDRQKLNAYIDKIYETGIFTNRGPLVQELEERLRQRFGVKHLILVANGTIALSVAFKALDLKGEVITTPFSFVATTSSLVWEGLKPVFVDIHPDEWNIDPRLIESAITTNTSAILPVHVFGNPCRIFEIQDISHRHKLKVIYDGAHAFDSEFDNKSVFHYGDISTLSFHATKLFHTIEGGAIITHDDNIAKRIRRMINFGIENQTSIPEVGINAKMNEFEAAVGLCVLDEIELIKSNRERIFYTYLSRLKDKFQYQTISKFSKTNFSYFPIVFPTETNLIYFLNQCAFSNIFPRRYFYPSLNTLPFLSSFNCTNGLSISKRIACLPLFTGIANSDLNKICELCYLQDTENVT